MLAIVLTLSLSPVTVLAADAADQNSTQTAAETAGLAETTDDAPYVTWKSATVATAGQTASFRLTTYSSDYTASQVWFAVNVAQHDQAIQMAFKSVTKSMYAYVYKASG